LSGEQLQTVFTEFKELADKKKEIYDGDLTALIEKQLYDVAEEQWSLVSFEVTSGTGKTPHVRLTLRCGDEDHTEELSAGDGPVDAAFLTTEKITGIKLLCKDYQVRAASLGRDAQAEVTLDVEHEGEIYRGRGVSTDTVEATVKAILNAVNRIAMQTATKERKKDQATKAK
jgi:2-isopropylmalate synthase